MNKAQAIYLGILIGIMLQIIIGITGCILFNSDIGMWLALGDLCVGLAFCIIAILFTIWQELSD